jgi:hypothetical protein
MREKPPEANRRFQLREINKMRFEVTIEKEKYMIEAPNIYEAKVKGSREHSKKYPSFFPTGMDVMAKTKILVLPVEEKN